MSDSMVSPARWWPLYIVSGEDRLAMVTSLTCGTFHERTRRSVVMFLSGVNESPRAGYAWSQVRVYINCLGRVGDSASLFEFWGVIDQITHETTAGGHLSTWPEYTWITKRRHVHGFYASTLDSGFIEPDSEPAEAAIERYEKICRSRCTETELEYMHLPPPDNPGA